MELEKGRLRSSVNEVAAYLWHDLPNQAWTDFLSSFGGHPVRVATFSVTTFLLGSAINAFWKGREAAMAEWETWITYSVGGTVGAWLLILAGYLIVSPYRRDRAQAGEIAALRSQLEAERNSNPTVAQVRYQLWEYVNFLKTLSLADGNQISINGKKEIFVEILKGMEEIFGSNRLQVEIAELREATRTSDSSNILLPLLNWTVSQARSVTEEDINHELTRARLRELSNLGTQSAPDQ